MRSQVVKSDGTITIIHDPYERRMAAKTLISKAVDIFASFKMIRIKQAEM